MKLLYFAWVRERVGKTDEDIVAAGRRRARSAELMDWLAEPRRGIRLRLREPRRSSAPPSTACTCRPDTAIAGAREIAFFPADDGRLAFARAIAAAATIDRSGMPVQPMTLAARSDERHHPPAARRLRRRRREPRSSTRGRTDIGAVVTFTGICRDRRGRTRRRRHDARALSRHGRGRDRAPCREDAQARWPLLGVTVIHRYGRMRAGRQYRAGRHRLGASRGGVRGRRIPDGLSQDHARRSGSSRSAPDGNELGRGQRADDAAAGNAGSMIRRKDAAE